MSDKGKWSEGKVQDQLNIMAEQADFNFIRLPDARAGSFQPTTCDFFCARAGVNTFIEVKEVNHLRLLPTGNFESGQRARMRKWVLAGDQAIVLICFTPLRKELSPQKQTTGKIWCGADLKWFDDRANQPSWNTEELARWSLQELLDILTQKRISSIFPYLSTVYK